MCPFAEEICFRVKKRTSDFWGFTFALSGVIMVAVMI